MMALTHKKAKSLCSEDCEKSFQELKDRQTSAPLLSLQEGTNGFMVYCNESKVGLGCVLIQNDKMIYSGGVCTYDLETLLVWCSCKCVH